MLHRASCAAVLAALATLARSGEASADDGSPSPSQPASSSVEAGPSRDRLVFGVSTDVLPIALSAVAGEPGGTLALGLAHGRVQVRALAFRVALPDFAYGAPAFDRVTSVGGGVIGDYFFFSDDQRGLWLAAGLEVGFAAARHGATQETKHATVVSPTVSLGWQWRLGPGFFIGPHAGFTYALNPARVTVGADTLEQAAFAPEVSIKLGWYFGL